MCDASDGTHTHTLSCVSYTRDLSSISLASRGLLASSADPQYKQPALSAQVAPQQRIRSDVRNRGRLALHLTTAPASPVRWPGCSARTGQASGHWPALFPGLCRSPPLPPSNHLYPHRLDPAPPTAVPVRTTHGTVVSERTLFFIRMSSSSSLDSRSLTAMGLPHPGKQPCMHPILIARFPTRS